MGICRILGATLLIQLILGGAALADSAAEQLHGLFDDEFDWRLSEFPGFAMSLGDYGNADHISDNSLVAIKRRQQDTIKFLQRLHAISKIELDESDRLN